MRKHLLISVATAALISATGFASAQSSGNAPSAGGASQSAPSASPSGPSGAGHSGAGQMNRGETTGQAPSRSGSESGMKSEGGMRDSQSDHMKSGDKASGTNAQEHEKSTGKSAQDNEKATGKSAQDNMRNDQKGRSDTSMDRSKDGMKNEKNATDNNARSSTTTGQAASGAKLTTEQRTQVRDVITNEKVKSVTNVNFSISVGTRVPRSGVEFHPLPARVVSIYPDWRGYEFFVVREQIVVVDPHTYEIVAVLES
jgi:Protein of unknown function (DUF1236)